MIKDTVVLSVHNRDAITLWNVIRGLVKNDLTDTEVLVIDDGSSGDYKNLCGEPVDFLKSRNIAVNYIEMADYDAYRINGHNNPARVNNVALATAKATERIIWLSSDCIIPPHTLTRARLFDAKACVYTAQVVDMDTGTIFNGPSRMFPMMWCVVADADTCRDLRFDEKYLEGMAFEDNDFMGRLAVRTGRIAFDWSVLVFHQSHPGIAYSDDLAGFQKSAAYTEKKWHGIPFDSTKPVLTLKKGMHELGVPEWTVGLATKDSPVATELGISAVASTPN